MDYDFDRIIDHGNTDSVKRRIVEIIVGLGSTISNLNNH